LVFTDNTSKDGTIIDNVTALMWQSPGAPTTMSQSDASAYCEGLGLAGHDDWRLPTKIELLSIVDYYKFNPAISAIFQATQAADYWTSTVRSGRIFWYVNFNDGAADYYYHVVDDLLWVRCLR